MGDGTKVQDEQKKKATPPGGPASEKAGPDSGTEIGAKPISESFGAGNAAEAYDSFHRSAYPESQKSGSTPVDKQDVSVEAWSASREQLKSSRLLARGPEVKIQPDPVEQAWKKVETETDPVAKIQAANDYRFAVVESIQQKMDELKLPVAGTNLDMLRALARREQADHASGTLDKGSRYLSKEMERCLRAGMASLNAPEQKIEIRNEQHELIDIELAKQAGATFDNNIAVKLHKNILSSLKSPAAAAARNGLSDVDRNALDERLKQAEAELGRLGQPVQAAAMQPGIRQFVPRQEKLADLKDIDEIERRVNSPDPNVRAAIRKVLDAGIGINRLEVPAAGEPLKSFKERVGLRSNDDYKRLIKLTRDAERLAANPATAPRGVPTPPVPGKYVRDLGYNELVTDLNDTNGAVFQQVDALMNKYRATGFPTPGADPATRTTLKSNFNGSLTEAQFDDVFARYKQIKEHATSAATPGGLLDKTILLKNLGEPQIVAHQEKALLKRETTQVLKDAEVADLNKYLANANEPDKCRFRQMLYQFFDDGEILTSGTDEWSAKKEELRIIKDSKDPKYAEAEGKLEEKMLWLATAYGQLEKTLPARPEENDSFIYDKIIWPQIWALDGKKHGGIAKTTNILQWPTEAALLSLAVYKIKNSISDNSDAGRFSLNPTGFYKNIVPTAWQRMRFNANFKKNCAKEQVPSNPKDATSPKISVNPTKPEHWHKSQEIFKDTLDKWDGWLNNGAKTRVEKARSKQEHKVTEADKTVHKKDFAKDAQAKFGREITNSQYLQFLEDGEKKDQSDYPDERRMKAYEDSMKEWEKVVHGDKATNQEANPDGFAWSKLEAIKDPAAHSLAVSPTQVDAEKERVAQRLNDKCSFDNTKYKSDVLAELREVEVDILNSSGDPNLSQLEAVNNLRRSWKEQKDTVDVLAKLCKDSGDKTTVADATKAIATEMLDQPPMSNQECLEYLRGTVLKQENANKPPNKARLESVAKLIKNWEGVVAGSANKFDNAGGSSYLRLQLLADSSNKPAPSAVLAEAQSTAQNLRELCTAKTSPIEIFKYINQIETRIAQEAFDSSGSGSIPNTLVHAEAMVKLQAIDELRDTWNGRIKTNAAMDPPTLVQHLSDDAKEASDLATERQRIAEKVERGFGTNFENMTPEEILKRYEAELARQKGQIILTKIGEPGGPSNTRIAAAQELVDSCKKYIADNPARLGDSNPRNGMVKLQTDAGHPPNVSSIDSARERVLLELKAKVDSAVAFDRNASLAAIIDAKKQAIRTGDTATIVACDEQLIPQWKSKCQGAGGAESARDDVYKERGLVAPKVTPKDEDRERVLEEIHKKFEPLKAELGKNTSWKAYLDELKKMKGGTAKEQAVYDELIGHAEIIGKLDHKQVKATPWGILSEKLQEVQGRLGRGTSSPPIKSSESSLREKIAEKYLRFGQGLDIPMHSDEPIVISNPSVPGVTVNSTIGWEALIDQVNKELKIHEPLVNETASEYYQALKAFQKECFDSREKGGSPAEYWCKQIDPFAGDRGRYLDDLKKAAGSALHRSDDVSFKLVHAELDKIISSIRKPELQQHMLAVRDALVQNPANPGQTTLERIQEFETNTPTEVVKGQPNSYKTNAAQEYIYQNRTAADLDSKDQAARDRVAEHFEVQAQAMTRADQKRQRRNLTEIAQNIKTGPGTVRDSLLAEAGLSTAPTSDYRSRRVGTSSFLDAPQRANVAQIPDGLARDGRDMQAEEVLEFVMDELAQQMNKELDITRKAEIKAQIDLINNWHGALGSRNATVQNEAITRLGEVVQDSFENRTSNLERIANEAAIEARAKAGGATVSGKATGALIVARTLTAVVAGIVSSYAMRGLSNRLKNPDSGAFSLGRD